MANMLTSYVQKAKQRDKLKFNAAQNSLKQRDLAQRQEDFFVKRLSEELNVDINKIREETEDAFDQERKQILEEMEKQKQEVLKYAIHNKKRLDQAIKTYDKHGLIDALHKHYPNQPNLRMKFAYDWEGSYEPPGVPGIGSEYALADIQFDHELNAEGEPLPVAGHDGLCKRFRAYAHACAGDRRFGNRTARTEQQLIFRHDPPPSLGGAQYCAINEVWVPMTILGYIYAVPSDAIFFSLTNALSSRGHAAVKVSVHVEQDTDHSPLFFPVVEDRVIDEVTAATGNWIFGGFGVNSGHVDLGAAPIDATINEPYRLPIMLQTADHGGGEVRVVVKFNTYAKAVHRHAEAEIDLRSEGCGVTIHEVLLHVAAYIGH
ncbi:MAG TPA: hypothetical protein EYP80_01800 [Candidatus Aenigmarchaeota archaeon]|nr:hypothetical protein [Candidatus Aenigmarchaeota archaeon]